MRFMLQDHLLMALKRHLLHENLQILLENWDGFQKGKILIESGLNLIRVQKTKASLAARLYSPKHPKL